MKDKINLKKANVQLVRNAVESLYNEMSLEDKCVHTPVYIFL